MTDITKEETKQLKGIAIIMMVFCHLFASSWIDKYSDDLCLIYIGQVPLVSYLHKFGFMVSMFLFLGGFGLYKNGKQRNGGVIKRIPPLLCNFWIILILFISIGTFIKPEKYPGTFETFILNFFCVLHSYNGEWWFLAPYIILMLCSKPIFRLVDKYNGLFLFIIVAIIGFIQFILTYFNREFLYNTNLYNQAIAIVTNTIGCSVPFIMGCIFAKHELYVKIRQYFQNVKWRVSIIWTSVFLLIVSRIIIDFTIFYVYYTIIIIAIYISSNRWTFVDKTLLYFGKHSTNIWLTHTFFCSYLFPDFVYSFRYPIIILLITFALSIMSSYIINMIFIPIKNKILQPILIKQ